MTAATEDRPTRRAPTSTSVLGSVFTGLTVGLPLAFVIGLLGWFPSSWFVEQQLLDSGQYYPKVVLAQTWSTVGGITAFLLVLGTGVLWLGRGMAQPTWSAAIGPRLVRLVGGGALVTVALGLVVLAAFRPEHGPLLQSFVWASFPAATVGLAFLFDGVCPPWTVEGPVEREILETKDGRVHHLILGEHRWVVAPAILQAVPDGTHARVLVTGYLGRFISLERA